MPKKTIKINRAPVLTLWAAVVAERLGHGHATALTLAKSVAGLNAQSKGQRLGIYEPAKDGEQPKKKPAKPGVGETQMVPLLGRAVPAVQTEHGLRATAKGQPIDPDSVERYLEKKFGEALPEVQAALAQLARAQRPAQLAQSAYGLYEKFRPQIPEGPAGWGAAGVLDLDKIRSLAKARK